MTTVRLFKQKVLPFPVYITVPILRAERLRMDDADSRKDARESPFV